MKLARFLPRFRAAYREMDRLADREKWSRSEIEAWQLERLNAVWHHATQHVPYYSRLAQARRLPASFRSLQEYQAEVPLLSKDAVRNRCHDFLSDRAQPGYWKRTGGSTGSPMSVFWGREAHWQVLRAKYRFQSMWHVDPFDRAAYLWGHSASFQPGLPGWIARCRQPLEDWLRNRLRLSAYQLSHDRLRAHLDRIARFRPALIYGYAMAMNLLAREAEETGFQCDSLRLFVMTSEIVLPSYVATAERALSVPAVVEYGSIDCGLLAAEWPDRTLRVREDLVLLETLPRPDGRYDVVVSVLNNPSFPLLRYQLLDTTTGPLELPERGLARLPGIAGREENMVVTRTGAFLHPSRFDALFKYETRGVRRFTVKQQSDGALHVKLELYDSARPGLVAAVERKLMDLTGGCPVRTEIVSDLPGTLAGKHQLVMSELTRGPASHAVPPVQPANGKSLVNNVTPNVGQARDTAIVACSSAVGTAVGQSPKPGNNGSAAPRRESHKPTKPSMLRKLIESPELSFIMEAHNGLSAKIVEEAGFQAIWASGLSISATLGVRDSNEASWTQVLEVIEFISDATTIPILLDGDTGYGNFNNMRRLVRKLGERRVGGVCIEDKVFPKTNSFLHGTTQPLADIEEFCGRIKAGKDAQQDDDFVIVARVEALIAGWGMQEALRRAAAYHHAGADAILIHSTQRSPHEVLAFKKEWGDRLPVIIVPTKYYSTSTSVFREHGFSAVIWANHMMRSCITAMQRTARQIQTEESLVNIEDRVAPLAEVFRLQGARELEEAEKQYLPKVVPQTRAIVLAAAHGPELGELTAHRPKCMVPVGGEPVLAHVVNTFRAAGLRDIAVVRGYCKQAVNLPDVQCYDNDDEPEPSDAYSLYRAAEAIKGYCLIAYGDVLFKKYIPQELIDVEADFAVIVDTNWRESRNRDRYADYVTCSVPSSRRSWNKPVTLTHIAGDIDPELIHGEWMGFLKLSSAGSDFVRQLLSDRFAHGPVHPPMDMAALMREILGAGKEIRVIYTTGNWFDVDSLDDVVAGSTF